MVLAYPLPNLVHLFLSQHYLLVKDSGFVLLNLVIKVLELQSLVPLLLQILKIAFPPTKNDSSLVQLLLNPSQLPYSLVLFLLVNADASNLLNHPPLLKRAHIYKSHNISLEDDVVAVRVNPCPAQQFENLLPGPGLAINPVSGLAIAPHHSGDFYLFPEFCAKNL